MSRNVTEIQQRLIDRGFLAPLNDSGLSNADGTFGTKTLAAYNRFRASKGEPPHTGLLLLVEVSADVFPEDTPPPVLKLPSIFDQIGTALSILNLLKGKTMTQDQINGIIRLALGLIGGYFVSRGVVSQSLVDWISAGLLTAVPAVWSWYSNRPKTIVPIAAK